MTTSVNCMTDAHDAYLQMKVVYDQFAIDNYDSPIPLQGKAAVKAIHYIQSFADEENVTPELAHDIAKAFVRKTFGEEVQAVIATHVDADHIHNHIIINSYNLSGKKYYDNQTTLRRVRETTNGVCRALGVKPALNFENKGMTMHYNEWQHNKNGTSWKEKIRQEIDSLIGLVSSLDELLSELEERGYEIKRGKYISLKAPGQQRFVRTKTLGEEYTEESLNNRIINREVGTGETPELDEESSLWSAYISVIGDVRILAEHNKKIQRKYDSDLPYSADNDLDVYHLSAQLSVINKYKIGSIGELEGAISRAKAEYEKQRTEINNLIEQHNRMVSLFEQAQQYFSLLHKGKQSASEQRKLSVFRLALERNSVYSPADVDSLYTQLENMGKKISALKENLKGCKKRYDVYMDIHRTYTEISKGDYISKLMEEERMRKERKWKNQRSKKQ